MKQIIQNLRNGDTSLIEVPILNVAEGHLLIQSINSAVSIGTEKMLIDFAHANWIQKIKQQPDRLKQVVDKIKTDGLSPTIEAINHKINKPIPLGYSNAGKVIAVGKNVKGFKVGDRVASNGAHAEVVHVPQNLCALIPDNVSFDDASFTTISSIALQGIRLSQPTFGETIVVIGLGIIGQIAVQLLKANGCNVIGIDNQANKCEIANQWGIKTICSNNVNNIAELVIEHNSHRLIDSVLICANAKNDTIISDAAKMCRKKGKIVLIGVVNLDLKRSDFYEKELSFHVSSSYGPGRYDYNYEQLNIDYPIAYVRWTAQRNFESVLSAMSKGQLKIAPLIKQKIDFENFSKVYDSQYLKKGIVTVFQYPNIKINVDNIIKFDFANHKEKLNPKGGIALIGSGDFSSKVILPTFSKLGIRIDAILNKNGLSASQLAKNYHIETVSTDNKPIFENDKIGSVIIATPHNTHASLCIDAIKHHKNIFVEKPLAINIEELNSISNAYLQHKSSIHVGFNRRFAPLAQKAKSLIDNSAQINMIFTINAAGVLDKNHWLSNVAISGGRIIGEVCHFIDLASFLCNSKVSEVCTNAMHNCEDDVTILLKFENGSAASINYFTNGSKAYDKERVEIYTCGKTLIIENWKKLTGFGFKNFTSISMPQDKGHYQQFKQWYLTIQHAKEPLISFESIYNTTAYSILALDSLKAHKWLSL